MNLHISIKTATLPLVVVGVLFLTGCAQTQKLSKLSVTAVATTQQASKDSTTEKVGRAALTPLSDLNLVQEGIPDILLKAKADPSAGGKSLTCDQIFDTKVQLAEALDIDKPTKKKTILVKGKDMLESQGVSMVQRTVEGAIPFRGWIRKLSGAEKHSKEVASAISAGHTRYAYLTGVYEGKNCDAEPDTVVADVTP